MFGDGWMGFAGGFMWLFWILVIVVIVAFVRGFGGGASPDRTESPMEILKKRYARGEIDDDEYQRRCKELEQ